MNMKLLLAAACGAAITLPVLAVAAHEMQGPMAGPMTRSALEAKIKEHFAKVDTNGDGFIDKTEAEAARTKMMAEMEDRHFKDMDTNGDGSISRAEFDAFHRKPMAMGGEREGGPMGHRMGMGMGMGMMDEGAMFERADANKDGRVSLAEALALPLARFDKADTNKDGTLSPQERMAAHEMMRGDRMQKGE